MTPHASAVRSYHRPEAGIARIDEVASTGRFEEDKATLGRVCREIPCLD